MKTQNIDNLYFYFYKKPILNLVQGKIYGA